MRLPDFDWLAAFTRWWPYATLVLVSLFALKFPTSAFVLLAIIHWATLDVLRTRRPIQIDLGLNTQAASVEAKHRLCGDEVSVTNNQVYRIGNRHYLVQVSRTERDLEGRELA